MRQRLPAYIFLGALTILGVTVLLRTSPNTTVPCADFNQEVLQVGDYSMRVSVAASSTQQSRGLGGCNEVPVGHGMYFPFPEPKAATFWMKNMLIPIDIIWISEGRITGIEHEVPPPTSSSIPNSELATYNSPGEVNAVLEVAAGQSKALNLTIGTSAILGE